MKSINPFSLILLTFLAAAAYSQVADRKSVGLATSTSKSPPPLTPIVLSSNQVAAAFAKGMPLLENSQFKVQAAHREGPGIAEVHTRDTDIFYFLEGSATFVTGGTTISPTNMTPEEIRAPAIQGGESRHLGKGDIIVVPNGVPHWFKNVEGTLLYYVVKVTSADGAAK